MSEFSWIETYFRPLAQAHPESLQLQDDAALLECPANTQLVITTDMLHEGVHFLAGTTPHLIAQKALRCNLSDLAAMGAVAFGYTLALGLPRHTDAAWLADFTAGLAADQQTFGCGLLGGDTTATLGPLSIAITAYGHIPHGKAHRRTGAQIGDDIYVSGPIGDAYIGLRMAKGELPADNAMIARYELPMPRLELGVRLQGLATACLDISDGLLQDMEHICTASSCAAALDASHIPLSPTAHQLMGAGHIHLPELLAGGDDYELLFTASPMSRLALDKIPGLTRIGTIRQGSGLTLYDAHGDILPINSKGYQHFK